MSYRRTHPGAARRAQRDVPRIYGFAGALAVRVRTPGGGIDEVCGGVSAFVRSTAGPAGWHDLENAQRNGGRRGSSTVSAGSARGPVNNGVAARGIRRASGYRMIGVSHDQLLISWFG